MAITPQTVRDLFIYNPTTGEFRRKGGKPITGKQVSLDGGWPLKTHLIWLYHYGKRPETGFIDHKDRNKNNNRIDNLREATHSQNCMNRARGNSTGFKGVQRQNSVVNPYMAHVTIDGCKIYLGSFKTAEEAGAAYRKAATKLHGEFAQLEAK